MADFRQDPIWFRFVCLWVIFCLGLTFLFPSDIATWIKALCATAALISAIALVPTIREMWRIARTPPGVTVLPSFRRGRGKHVMRD